MLCPRKCHGGGLTGIKCHLISIKIQIPGFSQNFRSPTPQVPHPVALPRSKWLTISLARPLQASESGSPGSASSKAGNPTQDDVPSRGSGGHHFPAHCHPLCPSRRTALGPSSWCPVLNSDTRCPDCHYAYCITVITRLQETKQTTRLHVMSPVAWPALLVPCSWWQHPGFSQGESDPCGPGGAHSTPTSRERRGTLRLWPQRLGG